MPIANEVPIGTILMWAGGAIPTDFLECNGQAIDRTDYADLFALIGETYGLGDGVDTFNLPDFDARFPVGEGAAAGLTTKVAGETGGLETLDVSAKLSKRRLQVGDRRHVGDAVAAGAGEQVQEEAAMPIMPPYLCVHFIIRAVVSA